MILYQDLFQRSLSHFKAINGKNLRYVIQDTLVVRDNTTSQLQML